MSRLRAGTGGVRATLFVDTQNQFQATAVMTIESTVNRLLASQLHYTPIDLLKAEDQLSEEHCRAWQTGEISSLDEAFRHPRRIRRLLQSAASFARSLNLVSEPVTYFGVDGLAGEPLAASTDPLLNELLSCRYSPPDSDRSDLFMDGGRTASINALMVAIVMRDPVRALRLMQRGTPGTPGTPGTADGESVSIRSELKQIRPGLLRSYLARRDRER